MNAPIRRIVCMTLVSAVLLTAAFLTQCAPAKTPETETFIPRLDNYADLYLRGSYDLLHMMKVRELEKIGTVSKIAAQRKMAGGTVWSFVGTPHIMYAGACDEDVPGNPNIAPDYNINHPKHPRKGGLPELGEGDFLIVAGPVNQQIRKRGCYIVGVGYPMSTNRYSPSQYNDHSAITMESQVDTMIYTWGPKEDGLVTPALTPHLKILPTSPMTVVGYWMLMAQIAHNLAYDDTSGSYEAAEAYLDTLMSRLKTFHRDYIDDISEMGDNMAERILGGGKLYVWSSRWEFFQEAGGTAGGLMGIYPMYKDGFYTEGGSYSSDVLKPPPFVPEEMTPKDIVLLAVAGDTPEYELDLAREIRAQGSFLVGIYPFKREDGVSTKEMSSLCDMSFDTLSGDKWGVLSMPGYDTKIIPTMAMMNNYAFWAIVGSYVQAMEARGVAPYYWMSWHVPGGKAYTDSIHPLFMERGY